MEYSKNINKKYMHVKVEYTSQYLINETNCCLGSIFFSHTHGNMRLYYKYPQPKFFMIHWNRHLSKYSVNKFNDNFIIKFSDDRTFLSLIFRKFPTALLCPLTTNAHRKKRTLMQIDYLVRSPCGNSLTRAWSSRKHGIGALGFSWQPSNFVARVTRFAQRVSHQGEASEWNVSRSGFVRMRVPYQQRVLVSLDSRGTWPKELEFYAANRFSLVVENCLLEFWYRTKLIERSHDFMHIFR